MADARRPRTRGSRPGGGDSGAPESRRPSAATGRGRGARGNPGRKPAVTRGEPEEEVRPTATLRGLGLFLVVLVAFVVLAPTLRHGVAQQEQLRRLRADVEAVEQRNAELEAEIQRWEDPAFVQAQARERLGYTVPGEQVYRVIDVPDEVEEEPDTEDDSLVRLPDDADTPWYLTVWDSIEIAGTAPAVPVDEESVTGEDASS